MSKYGGPAVFFKRKWLARLIIQLVTILLIVRSYIWSVRPPLPPTPRKGAYICGEGSGPYEIPAFVGISSTGTMHA